MDATTEAGTGESVEKRVFHASCQLKSTYTSESRCIGIPRTGRHPLRNPENMLAENCLELIKSFRSASIFHNILHKSTKIENPALSKHISILLGAISNSLFNMSLDCIPPLVLNAID